MRPHTGPVCPVHGEMDPTWTRCPQCIREGRDGRLVLPGAAGAVSAAEPVARPQSQAAPAAPGWPPAPAPPPVEQPRSPAPPPAPPPSYAAQGQPPMPPAPPAPAIRETMPPPEPPPAPLVRATVPPQPAAPAGPDRPVSSVGGTVVIRRRPRALAYLIEKEGEQVGRVFQLEQDVTDIGRDPRNHVVVTDVLVSGWHARVERAPDGGYVISDRGSTNGSRLNGEPLADLRPLRENDEFGLGNTTLVLKVVQ